MVVQVHQCNGITVKGQRCKITVCTEQGYCHYHIKQAKGTKEIKAIRNTTTKYHTNDVFEKSPASSVTLLNDLNDKYNMIGKFIAPDPVSFSLSPTPLPKPKPKTKTKTKPKTSTSASTSTKPITDAGYIYIYTMENFITPPKGWNFQVKNIPQTKKRHKDKWTRFKSDRSPYILVKIGMTTQLPNIRIKQWEQKCKHELVNLGPRNQYLVKVREHWWERFKRLTIRDDKESGGNANTVGDDTSPYTFQRFKNDGFHCKKNLKQVELKVHSTLREKYGKGDVYCSGCVPDDELTVNKNLKRAPLQNNYKVHIEWFLIPKADLQSVYKTIDELCFTIGGK